MDSMFSPPGATFTVGGISNTSFSNLVTTPTGTGTFLTAIRRKSPEEP